MKMLNKSVIYLVLIAVFAIATVVVLIVGINTQPARTVADPTPIPVSTEPKVVTKYVEKEKLVEIEKVITSQILQDGLRDMGVLITEEYYFTEVISASSIKQIFSFDMPWTESSYLATYDGVITAGIDLTAVKVAKDDEALLITVTVPKASIRNVDIDPNSFKLYSEKNGIGNPLSVNDFNRSLIELENTAKERALEKGLLTSADENARTVIKNFIRSLVDTTQYTVKFA